MRFTKLGTLAALVPFLAACSIQDSHVAERAQKSMIGISEEDAETCLGVPDEFKSFGKTDIATYYTSSSHSMSYTVPIVGGLGMSNGGSCHMTIRFDDQVATRILYSGEKNDTAAPDAFCAPIVRTCMATLDGLKQQKGEAYPAAKSFAPPGSRPS